MMYLVNVVREVNEEEVLELAGVFDEEEKAYDAKNKIEEWLEEHGYENYQVFVESSELNAITWYLMKNNKQ